MVRAGYRSRLTVEQGKIYWREVGKGPALVFLHSGWSDGTQWQAVIAQLSQHYRCYIPDLPGFGDSMLWSNQPVTVPTLVESFVQYAEALNLRRFSLVGNGLGGWVAASYALRFPYAVHRLMLLEPEGVSLPNQKWFCRWGQRLSVQTSVWAGLLETLAPLGELPGPLRDIKTLLALRRQMIASPLSGRLLYARPLKQISPEFLDHSLPKLLVPTLIMGRRGANPRKQILAERYGALCPMAEVALLPAHGETEQARILAQRIYDFVEADEPQYSQHPEAIRPEASRPASVRQTIARTEASRSLAPAMTLSSPPEKRLPAKVLQAKALQAEAPQAKVLPAKALQETAVREKAIRETTPQETATREPVTTIPSAVLASAPPRVP